MKNNFKEKMISAGIPWKGYQKQAWEMGKGLMHSKLYFDQRKSNMQEERSSEKAGFPLKSLAGMERMKKKKRNNTRGFHF